MARALEPGKFSSRREGEPPLRAAFRRKRQARFRSGQRAVAGLGQVVGQVGDENFRDDLVLSADDVPLKGKRAALAGSVQARLAIRADRSEEHTSELQS